MKTESRNLISFNSANMVAQQVNFNMTEGWGQGDTASNEWYRPLNTFAQRFEELIASIRALGFSAIDIWTGHLNWQWATDQHIESAREILLKHGVKVISYAGPFGATAEEFERACRLITALDCRMMGGSTELLRTDTASLLSVLREHQTVFAFENHPDEKTPQDVLALVESLPEDRVGITVDTGWFGTNGYPADRAIRKLSHRLRHVHLKDVLSAGAHETCRYGEGVVPVHECVQVLKDIGYSGAISVEHEPEHFDPRPDIVASRELLESWLAGA